MTPEQAAAFVNGQTAIMLIELHGMIAENSMRMRYDQAPAYTQSAFDEMTKRWEPVLGYNAILDLFSRSNNP